MGDTMARAHRAAELGYTVFRLAMSGAKNHPRLVEQGLQTSSVRSRCDVLSTLQSPFEDHIDHPDDIAFS